MTCDSRINIKKDLEKKGITDINGFIEDSKLHLFESINKKYTDYAKENYNISDKEPLFKAEVVKKIQLGTNNVGKPIYKKYYKIVPNEKLFSIINEKINKENTYYEPIDFDDSASESAYKGKKFKPEYEKIILYKMNLMHRLQNRLAKIKAEKKKYSTDPEKLKELTRKENEYKRRIEGDEIAGIIGLKEEIEELHKKPPIERFSFLAEEDFDRLEKLSQSENMEDLHEAKVIINFYKAIGTFDVNENHPLFERFKIFDDNGEIKLSPEVIEVLRDLKQKALKYENIIEHRTRKAVLNVINSHSKVKALFPNGLTYDKLFYTKEGLKDVSWVDLFIMDVTNGILSHNGIVPQVMMLTLKDTFQRNLAYAKSVEFRMSKLQEKVEKALIKLGYGISIPGVKGVSYDLFRAKDENGHFKDSITQRYTSKFFNRRNKMLAEFKQRIEKAKLETDPLKRFMKFKKAHAFRDSWYRKNTVVLDIRKIPEIFEIPAFSVFKKHQIKDDAYVKELKELLGEQGYKEEVEKQIKLLKDYKAAADVFVEGLLAEEGVDSIKDLSDNSRANLKIWLKRNHPFTVVESYYNEKPLKLGNMTVFSTMSYNHAVPRRKQVVTVFEKGKTVLKRSNVDTGYYDKRFEIIEANPVLKEFHNLLMEVNQKMFDVMPLEVREKFNTHSIPALKKSILEILFDPNLPFLRRITEAAIELYDRIRLLFGAEEQSTWSYATVDPITGIPEYKVNASFLKSNKEEIDRLYKIELIRLKKALGRPVTRRLSQFELFDLTKVNQEVIELLAEYLGVPPTLEAIQRRLPNENIKVFEMGRVLKEAITHQVVQKKSFDLPKIIKLYSYLTMEYAARQEVLPIVDMLKRHYERIKKPAVTSAGKIIRNASTKEVRLEGERIKAIMQMESWFRRVILGDYSSKNELGNVKIKRAAKIGFDRDKETKFLFSKLQTTITGRILTAEEKKLKKKLEQIVDDSSTMIKQAETAGDLKKIQELIAKMGGMEKDLGRHFSFASLIDIFYNFVRYKFLGWGLSSSITNFMEGQISNLVTAATGDYFTPENIYRASDIVKHSFIKNISFGKIATEEAKKARVLMDRYQVLQDAANELQKASRKSAFSAFKSLSPYEIVRRTEYLNQTPLMIAVLLDQKIVGKNGEVSNVWDAMNSDGTLKEPFRTEENIKNWEKADGQVYNNFHSHLMKTITNTHGDYEELRGMYASEYIAGKALIMFRRWMARMVFQRLSIVKQVDLETGVKDHLGRYITHTPATGMIHGALLGFGGLSFLGSGFIGLGAGAILGYFGGKLFGVDTNLSLIRESLFVLKRMMMNMIGIPINMLTGKQVIKTPNYDLLDGKIDERAIKNMRANIVDLSLLLSYFSFMLFVKGIFSPDDDDDDEEKERKTRIHNLLINRITQLSFQLGMYLNPTDFWEGTVGSMAPLRTLHEIGVTIQKAGNYLTGNDIILTGPNAGTSAFYNQFRATFFPSILQPGFGFKKQSERQFRQTPFDSWFVSEEEEARKAISAARLKYKISLIKKGLSKEKAKKQALKKYPYKKRGEKETYAQQAKKLGIDF